MGDRFSTSTRWNGIALGARLRTELSSPSFVHFLRFSSCSVLLSTGRGWKREILTRPHAHDTHTHTCARVWEMLCTHTTRANTARTRTNHIFFTHGDRTLRSDASTRQMSRQRPGSGLQRPLRCSMAPPAPFTHPPPASGGTDLHNENMQGGKWGVMRGSDAAGWSGRKPEAGE